MYYEKIDVGYFIINENSYLKLYETSISTKYVKMSNLYFDFNSFYRCQMNIIIRLNIS